MNRSGLLSSAKSTSTLGRSRKREVPDKSKDLSSSLALARLLQTRLQNLRLEKDLADKTEKYEKAFNQLSERNDSLADEIHEIQLRLKKIELYKDTIDKTKNEETLVNQILDEFKKLDSHLAYLKEKADSRQSLVTLSGIRPESAHIINDLMEMNEKISNPLASSVMFLLKNEQETKSLNDHIDHLYEYVNEKKRSFRELSESLQYLDKVRDLSVEKIERERAV